MAPEVLAALDNYYLIARYVVEGFLSGSHRSLYSGLGSEFVQYRNYNKGDDLKNLDWKVYARHRRLQLKIFEEETNSNCYIILDSSASMAYANAKRKLSKARYSHLLAASIAYLATRQGDKVGLYGYNERLVLSIPPMQEKTRVHHICQALYTLKAEGQAEHSKVLTYLGESCRRRGIVVFISDFIDADEHFFKLLRSFRHTQHDCILFQILDEDELNFPFQNTTCFIDSESNEQEVTDPESVREQYLQAFHRFIKQIKQECLDDDIDYVQMQNSEPLERVLRSYLNRRIALR